MSDLNARDGSQRILAPGTPAQVVGYSRNRVFLHLPDGDQTLGNDYSRNLDLEAFARRYIVEDDPKARLAAYPAAFKKAIESGQIMSGMTPEQVTMAIGYPVASETPDLNARTWRYQLADGQPYRVLWDDTGRVKNVAGEPTTRHAVFVDADGTAPDAIETAAMQKEELKQAEEPERPAHAAWLRSAIVGSPVSGRSGLIWFLQDNSTGCNAISLFFKSRGASSSPLTAE